MSCGKRIREERERLGYTQLDVANVFGITDKTHSRYELDKTSPDAEYLSVLATMGFDVNYIITGRRSDDSSSESEYDDVQLADMEETVEMMQVKLGGILRWIKKMRGK